MRLPRHHKRVKPESALEGQHWGELTPKVLSDFTLIVISARWA
jgi:hypothetical protein